MKKITGLTQRKHPYQLLSYLIFFSDLLVYILIITPLSNDPCKVILSLCLYSIIMYSGSGLSNHDNFYYIDYIFWVQNNQYRSY